MLHNDFELCQLLLMRSEKNPGVFELGPQLVISSLRHLLYGLLLFACCRYHLSRVSKGNSQPIS